MYCTSSIASCKCLVLHRIFTGEFLANASAKQFIFAWQLLQSVNKLFSEVLFSPLRLWTTKQGIPVKESYAVLQIAHWFLSLSNALALLPPKLRKSYPLVWFWYRLLPMLRCGG